jgi:hypothetical protein
MIRIGGHDFRVVYDRTIGPKRSRSGECYNPEITITINPDSCESQQKETLLHELVEAIDGTFDMRLDHSHIQILGAAFHQIIADNPHVFTMRLPQTDADNPTQGGEQP